MGVGELSLECWSLKKKGKVWTRRRKETGTDRDFTGSRARGKSLAGEGAACVEFLCLKGEGKGGGTKRGREYFGKR